jgi:hypothetical protein
VWLLSVAWGDVGWYLPQAKTAEELRCALEPLRGQPNEQCVIRFLRPTSVTATAEEIRAKRKALGKAIEYSSEAQAKHDASARAARVAEHAMNDASPETQMTFQVELFKQWGESAKARRELEAAQETEKRLDQEVKDQEASFSQHELLDFIAKKKYARNPLRLANAMAGLPDMRWGQSYARCSSLKCSQWPHFHFRLFRTIKAIWNRRNSHPELTLVQLFRREIEKLPKTVMITFKQLTPKPDLTVRQKNSLRSYIGDDFRLLRLAIEDISASETETEPDRVPFLILSRFMRNLSKPRTPQDLVLIAREKIDT